MRLIETNGILTHIHESGDPDGLPVVFANSLGTDLRVWDALLPLLPAGLRLIRYDKRGHGLSDCPPPPYGMGELVDDAAALLDALDVRDAVFVGLSIGGMIAQGLAAERPDLVRAIVLCDTAAKIGTEAMWEDRIAAVRTGGIVAIEGSILERWFSARFRRENTAELAGWRHMLTRTPAAGYMGCSAAIAHTDLMESTARLRLPALAVVGAEDGSTPPDLVRETARLIPGCRFEVIPGAGHLPCVEQPAILARHIAAFLDTLPPV
ncbi:3-oxoadipate enol-lactonase [Halovulum dunhuangense]|uniref:3-oxoadipate enol-lactonase n=1 Tax=Halovulum dunhuangense TaxID=1505036 RepID=A0A849KY00_9RHOB|nr:3-oxoadipate enol-lactonase [Halovulum dunhuangense]NNU79597.1 3-oxoadipate enol-lactonase [Halovulum dunhuangense]